MKNQNITRFEAFLLAVVAPGIVAGFAAMYFSGPWLQQPDTPEIVTLTLGPLLQMSYLANFLLIWASGILAVLVGLTIDNGRPVLRRADTR